MLKTPSIQAKDTFALVSPVCSIPARAFLSCGTSPYYNRSLYHRGGHKPYTQALNPYHRDQGCNRPLCCFSKIIPSFFIDKASCTRQFENEFSLHSLASLFPIKEGSTSHLGLLPSGKKRKTALRCSEPLRSKVGGPKRSSPCCAGWDRLGITCYNILLR